MLCAFDRSVHIEQDRIRLPGGPAAAQAWEALAGVPVSPLESFLAALFVRDEGRLAYFFDTLTRIDPSVRSAVLSMAGKGGLKHVKATSAAFVEIVARLGQAVSLVDDEKIDAVAGETRRDPVVRDLLGRREDELAAPVVDRGERFAALRRRERAVQLVS